MFFFLLTLLPPNIESVISTRSVNFDDVRHGSKLNGSVIKQSAVPRKSTCAILCTGNANCRSFNYCAPKTCQLNYLDAFSGKDESNLIVPDSNCVYTGTHKPSVPTCHGDEKNCDIDHKLDFQWGSWSSPTATVDNSTDYIESISRNCSQKNGEVVFPSKCNGSDSEIVRWYKWIREKRSWFASKANCESIGGVMFGNVDGTEAQLAWLLEKVGSDKGYIGLSAKPGESVWRNATGADVSALIIWHTGEPDRPISESRVARLRELPGPKYGFRDIIGSFEQFSICTMVD